MKEAPFAKNMTMSLVFEKVAPEAEAGAQKKDLGSETPVFRTTLIILIISNEEIKDRKMCKSLKDLNLLIKEFIQTIEN